MHELTVLTAMTNYYKIKFSSINKEVMIDTITRGRTELCYNRSGKYIFSLCNSPSIYFGLSVNSPSILALTHPTNLTFIPYSILIGLKVLQIKNKVKNYFMNNHLIFIVFLLFLIELSS